MTCNLARGCEYVDNSPLRSEFPTYPQPDDYVDITPKGDISTLSIRGHFYFGLTAHFCFIQF